jgi:hypothetical protein
MRYRVKGVHREQGSDISTTIEADSQVAAEAIANERGILVESVIPSSLAGDPASQPPLANPPGPKAVQKVIEELPLRPGYVPPVPAAPEFRFRNLEAFRFGFFAGWGMALVYVIIKTVDALFGIFDALVKLRAHNE